MAVEETRDELDDYETFDDVLRDAMKQLDGQTQHLSSEVRKALTEGRMKVDAESEEVVEKNDEEDEDG